MSDEIFFERAAVAGAPWLCIWEKEEDEDSILYEIVVVKNSPHIHAELESPAKHRNVAALIKSRLHDDSTLHQAVTGVETYLTQMTNATETR